MVPSRRQEPVSSVTIKKETEGDSFIFIAETRNSVEVAELKDLFSDLKRVCKVRPVATGPVTAYALKPFSDTPEHLSAFTETLDILQAVAPRYAAVYIQPLDTTSYRVVEDLALDTGSELVPLKHCDLCGRPEAFPTTLSARRGDRRLAAGAYCSRCVAALEHQSDRDLAEALIQADKRNFGTAHVQLDPACARRGSRLRFSARSHDKSLAAAG
ncbi:MAG: hypothetical protein ACUVTZ_08520 [Armatimonadota bacterium]